MARKQIDQTALLNSAPMTEDQKEDTRPAMEMYLEWQERAKAKLGVSDFREDVKADNVVLFGALERIKASGAPEPVIVRETVPYPPDQSKTFSYDVYVFTHWQNPRLQYRATEYMLALNPNVVINDLKTAGITRQL